MKKKIFIMLFVMIVFSCLYNCCNAAETKIEYVGDNNKVFPNDSSQELIYIYDDYEDYVTFEYRSESNLIEDAFIYYDKDMGKITRHVLEMTPLSEGIEKGKIITKKQVWDNGQMHEEIIDTKDVEINITSSPYISVASSIFLWNEKSLVIGDEISLEYQEHNLDIFDGYGTVSEKSKIEKIYGKSIELISDENGQGVYKIKCVDEGTSIIRITLTDETGKVIATHDKEYYVSGNSLNSNKTYDIDKEYDLLDIFDYTITGNDVLYSTDYKMIKLDKDCMLNKESKFLERPDFNGVETEYDDFSQRNYRIKKYVYYSAFRPGTQEVIYTDLETNVENTVTVRVNDFDATGNLYQNNKKGEKQAITLKSSGINLSYTGFSLGISLASTNDKVVKISEIKTSYSRDDFLKADLEYMKNGNTKLIATIEVFLDFYSDEVDERNGLKKYSKEWYEDIYEIEEVIKYTKEFDITVTDNLIPEKIILDRSSMETYVGMNVNISSSIHPNRGIDAEMHWESSNPDIADVDQNGNVIPKKVGTTMITVSSVAYPDICSTCIIKVLADNKQPKVNIYNEFNYLQYGPIWNQQLEKPEYGYWSNNIYLYVKDYNKNSSYSIEWNGNNETKLDSYMFFEYGIDVLSTNFRIYSKEDKNVNGIITVYETDKNGVKNAIYVQDIRLEKSLFGENNTINHHSFSELNRYNLLNIEVGDKIRVYGSETKIEKISGDFDVDENIIIFNKAGKVKFRILEKYCYNDSSQHSTYYVIDVKPKANRETKIEYGNVSYVGDILNVPVYMSGLNYGDYAYEYINYQLELKSDSGSYKEFMVGGYGGGYPYLTYDQRTSGGELRQRGNSSHSFMFACYPGKETVLIKDNDGKVVREQNVTIKEPYIYSTIPESISEKTIASSRIYKAEDSSQKLDFPGTEIKVVPSIEVINGQDCLRVTNVNTDNDQEISAYLQPTKTGKATIKLKYTLDYGDIDRINPFNDFDNTVNEYKYSKAWCEKKYGTISYEKVVTVNVEYESKGYAKGDLNRDGKVNAADATKALEIFKNESATAEDLEIGDMDGRNGINANDATMILEVFKNSNIE